MIKSYQNFINEGVDDLHLGKWSFVSFLRLFDTLQSDKEDSNDYLLFCKSSALDVSDFQKHISHYKSLETMLAIIKNIEYKSIQLFYGIGYGNQFQYGVVINGENTICGEFVLSKTNWKWILGLNHNSLLSYKKALKDLTYSEYSLINKIATTFEKFIPVGSFHSRSNPELKGKILSLTFCGLGHWDGPKILEESLLEQKENFKKWCLHHNWNNLVQIGIEAKLYWIYFKIKLKNDTEV